MLGHQQNQDMDFFTSLASNRIQEEVFETELATAARTNSSSIFSRKLGEESHRLAGFVDKQQIRLELAAKQIFYRAHSLSQSNLCNVSTANATLHDLRHATKRIVNDCVTLQEFYSQNRNILLQVASKADQELSGGITHSHYSTSILHSSNSTLSKAHLNSSLVCVVSDTFQALRQTHEKLLHGGGNDAIWQAPSSFERNTSKYWVPHESLTKLMMICAAEAPVLVYGKQGPLTSTNPLSLKSSDGDKLWDHLATKITSVYFDSDNMDLYHERLKRAEGAQLLRARWYGTKMPQGKQPIFLELKTHHERWVNRKSVKERATIQEKDMTAFLEPVRWRVEDARAMILRAAKREGGKEMKPAELDKQTRLLFRMHNLVVNHKLTACVRSVYDRVAFQSAKSNDLRLTLDRNVTLVNERIPLRSSESCWCLDDAQAQQTQEASIIPFNVFEVKLAGTDTMPKGLADAMNDNTIQVATKFSKFLTGAAAFNLVPVLPYWAAHPAFYSFFGMEHRMKNNATLTASQPGGEVSDDYQPINDAAGPSQPAMIATAAGSITVEGVTIAPSNPARIEPKTFFANERTFIQWLSASIMMLSISGYLINAEIIGGSYNFTAAFICIAAMALIVYSTRLYFKRLQLLKVREPYGYFNKVNPIYVTTVVGLTVFLVWADSIKGGDFLEFFSDSLGRGGRRHRRMLLRGASTISDRMISGMEMDDYFRSDDPCEAIATPFLFQGRPTAVVWDAERDSMLVTTESSIYVQTTGESSLKGVLSKDRKLVTIPHSRLEGLAYVGDRLFVISDGSMQMELMELTWWRPMGDNSHEQLRIIERWSLDKRPGRIKGFTFVPSIDSPTEGNFYIHMGSSIHIYSVPSMSVLDDDPSIQMGPTRLKSLNMKVLGKGRHEDYLSSMATFEGITYVLNSNENVLESWNMTDGTQLPDIKLSAMAHLEWSGFAFEGRSSSMYLHLLTTTTLTTKNGEQHEIWRFPAHESLETSESLGRFSVPTCPPVIN